MYVILKHMALVDFVTLHTYSLGQCAVAGQVYDLHHEVHIIGILVPDQTNNLFSTTMCTLPVKEWPH